MQNIAERSAEVVRRMVYLGAVALSLGLTTAAPARAQVDLLGPGAAYLAIGGSRISTSELDEYLETGGYPTFGESAVAIGLGGYRVLSSGIMLGAEAQGFIIGDAAHEGSTIGLGGGYATLGVGYAFDVGSRFRFYPRIGVGPGGMALWVEAEDTVAFDDVLEDDVVEDERAPNLSRDGVVLDLGAGFEFMPGRGPLIGVRAGYLTGPFTDTWESYDRTVSGGPDASIEGPYVRIVAGWAWKR